MAAKRETPTKATRKKPAAPRAAVKAPAAKRPASKPAVAKAPAAAAKPRKAASPARAAAKSKPVAAKAKPAARKPAVPRKKRVLPAALAPASLAPGLSEEERIEAAKYLPRDLPKRLFEEEQFLFPESYGVTRVRLLIKDPEWLFVHWDVDPKTLEALRSELGERVLALTRLTLRIADPDNGGSQTILLPPGSRSWYVRADAGRSRAYRSELGLTLPSGEFRSLAHSNTVVTPRVGPSPDGVAPRRRVFGSAPTPAGRAAQAAGEAKPASVPAAPVGLEPWKPQPEHTDAAERRADGRAEGPRAAPKTAGQTKGGASDAFTPPGASETHRR